METLVLAFGLVFLVEGLLWALAPGLAEQWLEARRALPAGARRQIGLLGIVTGLILLWIARALGA